MRAKHALLLILASAAALAFALRWMSENRQTDEFSCPEHLRTIGHFARMHAAGEGGRYPSNIQFIVEAFSGETKEGSRNPLHCPEAMGGNKSDASRAASSDYIFVNWAGVYTNWNAVPPDAPVCYDRALSNHYGRGIFVLNAGGEVNWDPRGSNLMRFIATNVAGVTPLPVDK